MRAAQRLAAASLLVRRCTRCLHVDDALPAGPGLRRVLRQLACDGNEQFVDIGRGLRARFHREYTVVVRVRLGLLGLDLSLRVKVRLVASERDDNVWVALPLQLLHPLLCALEGVPVGDIVHHNRSSSPAVVHGGERVIALLAGRVPDLKLDCGVVQSNSLREEGCANRGLLVLKELPTHKAQDQAGLADRAVSQEHELELEGPSCRSSHAVLWLQARSVCASPSALE
mmetsp:Transcript_39884/g.68447  ORF Transcript_39884/g.68447 Transcript_39884/m.68447 type:complete len:228 (-) Transcript_39884:5-688(-)